jgi:hypothetical protein
MDGSVFNRVLYKNHRRAAWALGLQRSLNATLRAAVAHAGAMMRVPASFGHDGGVAARRFSSPWPIDGPIKSRRARTGGSRNDGARPAPQGLGRSRGGMPTISRLLQCTGDSRCGSVRDTKPRPRRRQLSSRAVAGCGRRLHRRPLSTVFAIGGRTCSNCGPWGRQPWHLQRASARSRCATARCAGRTSRESGVRGNAWLGHRPSTGARYSSRKACPDDRSVDLNSANASVTTNPPRLAA